MSGPCACIYWSAGGDLKKARFASFVTTTAISATTSTTSTTSATMSETLVERYTPTNTRQDIIDIIDVDDWFPDARQHQLPQILARNATVNNRRQPQPADVIIIESDDDDEVQITGHNRPERPQRKFNLLLRNQDCSHPSCFSATTCSVLSAATRTRRSGTSCSSYTRSLSTSSPHPPPPQKP